MTALDAGGVVIDLDEARRRLRAGEHVISSGRHVGMTIAQVAAGSRGPAWIRWVLTTPDFPSYEPVKAYARLHFPDICAAALAELETQGQA